MFRREKGGKDLGAAQPPAAAVLWAKAAVSARDKVIKAFPLLILGTRGGGGRADPAAKRKKQERNGEPQKRKKKEGQIREE